MKRVLVTRPDGQNQALMAALAAQGFQPQALPMLEIVPFTPQQHAPQCQRIIEQVQQLAQVQHVIFVSTNAVHCAFHWIRQYQNVLPAQIHWYPIGEATASALAQYVDQAEQAGRDMDSETLLLNPQLQQLHGQQVLIFRGQGGRAHLHDELTARGATVQFCELYQRCFKRYPVGTLQAIFSDMPEFLLATSTETIQALLEQAIIENLREKLLNAHLIVPGQRVARFAETQGFTRVFASENAGLTATMDVLKTHNN